jgi:hypothetical protein
MTLLPLQDEKITCEVSEFLDSSDSEGWPIQAVLWLEWGSSSAGRMLLRFPEQHMNIPRRDHAPTTVRGAGKIRISVICISMIRISVTRISVIRISPIRIVMIRIGMIRINPVRISTIHIRMIRIRARIHACRQRRVISTPLGAASRG